MSSRDMQQRWLRVASMFASVGNDAASADAMRMAESYGPVAPWKKAKPPSEEMPRSYHSDSLIGGHALVGLPSETPFWMMELIPVGFGSPVRR